MKPRAGLDQAAPRIAAAAAALVIACTSTPRSSPAASADDAANQVFVPAPTTACRAPFAPPRFRLVDAFDGLRFEAPLALTRIGDDWLVAGQTGKVVRVSQRTSAFTAEPYLDLGDALAESIGESGLVGLVASPDWALKPELFVAYTGRSNVAGSVYRFVVSGLSSLDGGVTIDRSTERALISMERDEKGHNGGRLVFGPDRLLYAAIGDGSWGDPLRRAQDPSTLYGKVVRLDVLGSAAPAPEVFARGFRNPWSFSFDPSGRLWLGDVGHEAYEEINIVTKGGNYGWPLREGRHCFQSSPCDVPGAIDPVYEYPHVEGFSVTGGYVYRGAIPSLAGKYVFADFITGAISALDAEHPTEAELLLDAGRTISALAEDANGELLVVDYGGSVLRLADAADIAEEPATLASLGCLGEDGLVAYDVNAPLWSDGLDKRRWLGLPGEPVAVDELQQLTFPAGTILLKELSWQGRRIETRMMTKSALDGWLAYTFEWNDEQTDATLLRDGKNVDLGDRTWTIPSRTQCRACHRAAAGSVLGFNPRQLERGDQRRRLENDGIFSRRLGDLIVPALADPYDPSLPAEARARSYLDANCAHCHNGTGALFDLRSSVPLPDMRVVCWPAPGAIDPASARPMLVAPGDPFGSVLVQRMDRTTGGLMPPLGRAQVDTGAVGVIASWIGSLPPCP